MKTIAAISDIHGNILALEAVVRDIARRHVDTVVNLGDHLSGPLWPKETIQFLMQTTLDPNFREPRQTTRHTKSTRPQFIRRICVQSP